MGKKRKRAERFIKRLECEFSGSSMTYKGFVSNISETGLFIRTRRSFREGSDVDIKLLLPDDSTSNVSGVVRHARNYMESRLVKNGMGIELAQMDDSFLRLVRKMKDVKDTKEITEKPENVEPERKPEKVVIKCPACGVNNAVPRDKLSMGPKCGSCKASLAPKEEEPNAVETQAMENI